MYSIFLKVLRGKGGRDTPLLPVSAYTERAGPGAEISEEEEVGAVCTMHIYEATRATASVQSASGARLVDTGMRDQ